MHMFQRRTTFFILFTLSGFSGLIYESIWTHYLKLFLGHAAYAQTLVLAIFMGGMAIGSWLCSRNSGRLKNLLRGYAVAEGAIGLGALIFHELFTSVIDLSYRSIIPGLGSATAITIYKWGISGLLILPQSILLGMTFPLMSAGLLRRFPENPGKSVALLYFTNSLGAVAGVLASGFFMIRTMGLPGTVRSAGCVNVLLAIAVWLLASRQEPAAPGKEAGIDRPASRLFPRYLLAASAITGAASFIYEIGWIRMLSMVLGTSTHAFELMLSAFIFGLACGGLCIHRFIDRISSPPRFLAQVQIVMGFFALSTLVVYGETFPVMKWLVDNLAKNDTGYALFNLSSSAIAIAIMLPATFFAGMTLPLITLVLLRDGHGEGSIGAVYAANTVGAIAGVFFAIHVGLPLLGLKGVITSGAALDMGLGIALLWSPGREGAGWLPRGAATVCALAAIAAAVFFVRLDLFKMGSGVYRHGILLSPAGFRHLYHLDGKTATVDVFLDGLGSMRINTNGKTDATIMTDPERAAGMDEATMTLLGAIPMAIHPKAATVASIGLGSGFTTQVLLENPAIRRVDTVEIEQGMVEGARMFGPRVEKVYTDPRSRIHIDDAKTFFSSRHARYDIIISEPSNPWVSGVSGLFSEEFYRLIGNHIADDGLFVQWVQLYEIDTELVCSVLKGLSRNFSDYVIYAPDQGDIMIVAKKSGRVPPPSAWLFGNPALAAELKRINVENLQDIEVRKVGDKKLLEKLLASMAVRANSDYYPVLDQNASRTRFLNASAANLLYFAQLPVPAAQLLSDRGPGESVTEVTPTAAFPKSEAAHHAVVLRNFLVTGRFGPGSESLGEDDRQQAVIVRNVFFPAGKITGPRQRLEALFVTAENILPYLTPYELEAIWRRLEPGGAAAGVTPLERECLELFKAIGRRDGAGMATRATALLRYGRGLDGGMVRYVAASGMLGQLMQGNKPEARAIWSQYRPALFGNGKPDLLFRLLSAESSS
ncbi:hypothetical protein L4X63_21405 [Geomonas sp. Red32]|uniref:spermine/spermidine synthase domain-containing protein n=1 Tax=Geomonas sp. Red32 TaxID=2912856 RepID=UPI00202CCC6A|nr:hypothetical protein [Geomonas sp. Red32]MCM0084143.1 hypothetical protein [Geomonas sp. Red32]